ncbi:sugar phosphate isomerase/epimerase and 4-hydroxyphenylpyruvate domain-containing protein [Nocardioides mangrovi]|uniref:3-dehydroshikimate dehydratase n=1 Tax=Nocardioides mangrovi TaxID=2874580 RepID=A0ABS7UB90_9ACTN|nr:sugar phosphate isomerase/epimerase and 4-hydroxyphenylpyruvate domain-containing protein [Nocardioides mangrovi]MBZ5737991.1 sugar phosphate isomerase/epimerase and 4-hydroxyphenylpyruvate domain-containing protein [Nocardioides mangrovi]
MRTGIATVSLSGVLTDKLAAIAAAGFDGIEVFDNDLIASPLSPREVARRCADLGLAIDLFQPVRDVEGVPPDRFDAVLHRFGAKLGVMEELGATTVLCCSNVGADALDDRDLSAEQLHRLGDLAAECGVTIAFEALAWGRHVDRVGQAWDVVRRADHPAVTVAVDTFHLLARGDDGAALAGIPGDRIGFLQVADAPLLDMDVLEWSRHFRCFPGEGTLDVAGVVAATLAAGYTGPVSLEVFSDVVREADPADTARDAMRSLLLLDDQLRATLPPAPVAVEPAFLEVPAGRGVTPALRALGLAPVGTHRSKPVTRWSNGGVDVVVNDDDAAELSLGVTAAPVAGIAERAKALLWPEVDRTRGAGEALLPGIGSPSGLHLLVSAEAGGPDHWADDFVGTAPAAEDLVAIDHVVVAVPTLRLNEEVSFLRSLLALEPGAPEEFMEPHGRLRSRAFRPRTGGLRVVVNVEDTGAAPATGITQVALACSDVRARVRALRDAGVPLLAVPDNYYADLDARFGLDAELLADLRAHSLFYDRVGDGELLHAFTGPLATGFHVELLERSGGYDGYGSAGTHVRLAAQRSAGQLASGG